MKTIAAFLVFTFFLQVTFPLYAAARHAPASSAQPYIQVALLLDTSNSMDGLIAQAKSQLWNIVKELSNTTCRGADARLEIALYQYGNDGLSRGSGWIQQVSPFTNDLDRISEALFKLTTNGGSEHSPQVIVDACNNLTWRPGHETLRLLFIAGNEEFQQGPVTCDEACKAARAKQVSVTTIHCGNEQDGVTQGWARLSTCSEGKYLFIDGDYKQLYIPTPHDTRIEKLNSKLNSTYIPYGTDGRRGLANMNAQDANAGSVSSANFSERAVAKSSSAYTNSGWDFIDAVTENKIDLTSDSTILPEEFKKLKPGERRLKFEKIRSERGDIKKQITLEEANRQNYIREQQKKTEKSVGLSLESRMISSIHELASKKGFAFSK